MHLWMHARQLTFGAPFLCACPALKFVGLRPVVVYMVFVLQVASVPLLSKSSSGQLRDIGVILPPLPSLPHTQEQQLFSSSIVLHDAMHVLCVDHAGGVSAAAQRITSGQLYNIGAMLPPPLPHMGEHHELLSSSIVLQSSILTEACGCVLYVSAMQVASVPLPNALRQVSCVTSAPCWPVSHERTQPSSSSATSLRRRQQTQHALLLLRMQLGLSGSSSFKGWRPRRRSLTLPRLITARRQLLSGSWQLNGTGCCNR